MASVKNIYGITFGLSLFYGKEYIFSIRLDSLFPLNQTQHCGKGKVLLHIRDC